MKALKVSVVVSILVVIAIASNQRRVELVSVNDNQFCMYMDSYKSKNLGLIGCFNGNPHDVNEGNAELTKQMMETKPLIIVEN